MENMMEQELVVEEDLYRMQQQQQSQPNLVGPFQPEPSSTFRTFERQSSILDRLRSRPIERVRFCNIDLELPLNNNENALYKLGVFYVAYAYTEDYELIFSSADLSRIFCDPVRKHPLQSFRKIVNFRLKSYYRISLVDLLVVLSPLLPPTYQQEDFLNTPYFDEHGFFFVSMLSTLPYSEDIVAYIYALLYASFNRSFRSFFDFNFYSSSNTISTRHYMQTINDLERTISQLRYEIFLKDLRCRYYQCMFELHNNYGVPPRIQETSRSEHHSSSLSSSMLPLKKRKISPCFSSYSSDSGSSSSSSRSSNIMYDIDSSPPNLVIHEPLSSADKPKEEEDSADCIADDKRTLSKSLLEFNPASDQNRLVISDEITTTTTTTMTTMMTHTVDTCVANTIRKASLMSGVTVSVSNIDENVPQK